MCQETKKRKENSSLRYCPTRAIPLGLVEWLADLSARLGYSFHKFKPSAMFIVLAYNVRKHTQRHTRTDMPRVPRELPSQEALKKELLHEPDDIVRVPGSSCV